MPRPRTSNCWPRAAPSTGALSQASERKIVTVQPWVEQRDGKRFLHIPEGAGYRNLIREMPPQPVPQAGR